MGRLGGVVDADANDRLAGDGVAPETPISPSAQAAVTGSGSSALSAGTEKTSFGDFYADHYSDLVRLATLLSGSADSAPDLVHDCFVRLHQHWTAVHDPLPYVRRSVDHACASHHRSIARGHRFVVPEGKDSELGADELEDALAKLPGRQRAAVVLRYYGDLPDVAIARALRCQPGNVRSLIHRALTDLRKVIEP